jgi:hypothetical protein
VDLVQRNRFAAAAELEPGELPVQLPTAARWACNSGSVGGVDQPWQSTSRIVVSASGPASMIVSGGYQLNCLSSLT